MNCFTRSLVFFAFAAAATAPFDGRCDDATAGYHLKNRSTFTPDPHAKEPFWPIGYVHHDVSVQAAKVEFTLDASQFTVTSISLGNPSVAIINGRIYSENDFVHGAKKAVVVSGGEAPAKAPKIRVARIMDGKVILACENQTVSVPLKRQENAPHNTTEAAPSDDDN